MCLVESPEEEVELERERLRYTYEEPCGSYVGILLVDPWLEISHFVCYFDTPTQITTQGVAVHRQGWQGPVQAQGGHHRAWGMKDYNTSYNLKETQIPYYIPTIASTLL